MLTIEEAKDRLRSLLKPGDTVYTILRHVSRSGMVRDISTIIIRDGRPLDITYAVADLLELPRRDNGGLRISRCGMDMGFEIVYHIGSRLWPRGFADRGDGGYAFNQEWL